MTHSRPKLRKETPILSRRIAMLESKLEASSESIKSKIEAQSTKNNNCNVLKPKCPICFEEMSTKIAQCISSHLPPAVLGLQGENGRQGLRLLGPASQWEGFRDGGIFENHLWVNVNQGTNQTLQLHSIDINLATFII